MSSKVELSIRFTSDERLPDSPIFVSLRRVDTGAMTEPVAFEMPLRDEVLEELSWYLEKFSLWPVGPDYGRAEEIRAELEGHGRALLEGVTAERGSVRLWQQFVDAPGEGKLLTVDATDARVLRLPWELLADDEGHLFTQGIGVRRRLRKATTAQVKPLALPVRVLVVVARPDDAGFIDPRADALPLLNALEALEALGEQVAVEFLYPPTLKTLTARLRSRKKPPVHVVHFDGHGVYDSVMGLGYLLFENDAYQGDRVDADRLGTLLNRCGVPLMVLSACQSATQKEYNPYASVAARLIRAGVGSVLAMSYSVLVVAAQKFVNAFYGALAEGRTVGQAVDEGRFELLADEERHTLVRHDEKGKKFDEILHLRDWFLPALYQQNQDPVIFSTQTSELASTSEVLKTSEVWGVPQALSNPNAPGGLPAEPIHGFHGRTREMLQLERAFAKRAIIVLHGFGGMGKTALSAEAGRWFYRTGRFAGGAAFVSFEHGGSLNQLCSWVGQAISQNPDFLLGEAQAVAKIAAWLREHPALLILDNFESVLGKAPLMPADELASILDAVWQWGQAGARILITTRDTTLNDTRFMPSKQCMHLPLQGLAKGDALRMAKAVLDDHGIDRATIEREALEQLMERLGGHPLSLNLALPHLRQHSPADLSARFEKLLPGFSQGAAKERNESLAVSLDFSLRRLGDDTRAALPALALFQGGAMEYDLLAITEIDPDLWQEARTELKKAALVTIEPIPGVDSPFLRFHPTLIPYLASQLPAARRPALQTRYWQRYYALAKYLVRSDTKHPHQARAIALRELPNLHHALDLVITSSVPELVEGQPAEAHPELVEGVEGKEGVATDYEITDFATSITKFLNNFGRWRERDALMAKINRLRDRRSKEQQSASGISKADFLRLDQQGDILLEQGQAAQAEQLFRTLLTQLETSAAYDTAYDHAMTLFSLGRCLEAQGQPTQAIAWHKQALQGFEDLSESNQGAKEMLGKVYGELAGNFLNMGQFDKAQQTYERALKISKEVDGQRAIGVILSRLGKLALMRNDLAKAKQRYREALATFRRLGEPQVEGVVWHQLGLVAEKSEDWDEAERCYRESLKLEEQISDAKGIAETYNQLANVAKGAGRLHDAEHWYLRTIKLGEQLGDHNGLAKRLNNLASLYLSQGRINEAVRHAHRAVTIMETLDLSAEPWKPYNILARIASAQGHTEQAKQLRRKEQDSYAKYAGAVHRLPKWAPTFMAAVVAAVAGEQAGIEAVEAILPQLEAGGWQDFSRAIRHILAGERDFEALRVDLDFMDAYIIRIILSELPE